MAVEASSGNMEILCRFLEKLNVQILKANILHDINRYLKKGLAVSVAIIDIMGFGNAIWKYCMLLGEKGIPMLIISPGGNNTVVETGYAHGAKYVLKKPVLMQKLASLVKTYIQAEGL